MSESRSRRLRAVLRNALAWGVAWAAAGGAVVTVVGLFTADPSIESLPERIGMALLTGIAWSVRFGLAGAVIGTVFAIAIGLRYRGRRLADINPVLFALFGAVVGGLGVPLFLQTMNVLSGDGPVAWGLVSDDAIWASVFGAAAAAGSILLARRADAASRGAPPDRVAGASDPDALSPADPLDAVAARRARSAQR